LLDAVLEENACGQWLRERVQWMIVPFMDKDGVEAGDQGKNRRPHDHNKDWTTGNYASVRAVREALRSRAGENRLGIALDLHCPWVRGPRHEVIHIVGSANPERWQKQQAFGRVLASVQEGPLVYDPEDNLPYGTDWNKGPPGRPPRSFVGWAARELNADLAMTMEFPYAVAGGRPVTVEGARRFGASLARRCGHGWTKNDQYLRLHNPTRRWWKSSWYRLT
jgi:hypothetical protein